MKSWVNLSPGDLSHCFPEVTEGHPDSAMVSAQATQSKWAATPLSEKIVFLEKIRDTLAANAETIAQSLCLEIGKPITEARAEAAALPAKIDLTIEDAQRLLVGREFSGSQHPGFARPSSRGIAVVIGPFNFPLHLPHGAAMPHLLAGNCTIIKPSPLAACTAALYARLVAPLLPAGVLQVVQGHAETALSLCHHPAVRSIAFTGSLEAGRALSRELAEDLTKDLALELGGKNAVIVCDDADLDLAADSVAQGLCLTAGQRCNATSRAIVSHAVLSAFLEKLATRLGSYQPAYPAQESCKLGPLIHEAALLRYERLLDPQSGGRWIVEGSTPRQADGRQGHYVTPAILLWEDEAAGLASTIHQRELFFPLLEVYACYDDHHAVRLHDSTDFGLTASIFTRSMQRFTNFADHLAAGNIYANLATTFSPSSLPFGGWHLSGNGKPAGREFLRYTTREQVVQVARDSIS